MGIIEKYIMSFWQGKLKLWHSFWLVGGIGGIITGQIIIFLEQKIFNYNPLFPFDFTIRGKILVLLWIIFTTIGIWKSAENYNGLYFWKIITKIYIVINCLSALLLMFYFDAAKFYVY